MAKYRLVTPYFEATFYVDKNFTIIDSPQVLGQWLGCTLNDLYDWCSEKNAKRNNKDDYYIVEEVEHANKTKKTEDILT